MQRLLDLGADRHRHLVVVGRDVAVVGMLRLLQHDRGVRQCAFCTSGSARTERRIGSQPVSIAWRFCTSLLEIELDQLLR